jgi:hypothetical protein
VRRAKISGPAVKSGGLSVIKMADVCVGSNADKVGVPNDARYSLTSGPEVDRRPPAGRSAEPRATPVLWMSAVSS